MRYIVVSDIHGNLEALEAVLETAGEMCPDGILCLGDVVGYGPDPVEVIDLVRSREMVVVKGNHDQAAVDRGEEAYFNEWAAEAIRWTRDQLREEDVEFLQNLPYTAEVDGVLLVHASPGDPPAWRYVLSRGAAAAEFATFTQEMCLIGHSHVPMISATQSGRVWELVLREVVVSDDTRFLINVGSVGQPRDRDPRASFGVLDTDLKTLRIERATYDAETTSRKIIEAGLPRFLGERLLIGQ